MAANLAAIGFAAQREGAPVISPKIFVAGFWHRYNATSRTTSYERRHVPPGTVPWEDVVSRPAARGPRPELPGPRPAYYIGEPTPTSYRRAPAFSRQSLHRTRFAIPARPKIWA
jgi:hypothetical protein